MLNAFFDDSGTGLDSPVFVIAGYAGSPERWAEFSDRWDEVLKKPHRLKPQGIKYLKTSHAMAKEGEFKGWTDEERDLRLRELLSLVPEYGLCGGFVVIPVEIYRKIFVGFDHDTFQHPYFLGLYAIFPTLLTYLDGKNIVDQVKFTFDRTDHRKTLEASWDIFFDITPETFRSRIVGTLAFENEGDFPPLQAADALAWYVRRQFYEHMVKGTQDYHNEIFERLFKIEHVTKVLNDEDVMKVRAAISYLPIKATMTLPDPTSKLFGFDG